MSKLFAIVEKHFRSEPASPSWTQPVLQRCFQWIVIRKHKIPKDSSFNTLFKGGFSLSHGWVQGHVCPALGQPDLCHCLPQVCQVVQHSLFSFKSSPIDVYYLGVLDEPSVGWRQKRSPLFCPSSRSTMSGWLGLV